LKLLIKIPLTLPFSGLFFHDGCDYFVFWEELSLFPPPGVKWLQMTTKNYGTVVAHIRLIPSDRSQRTLLPQTEIDTKW
jgi:hypothetical protein